MTAIWERITRSYNLLFDELCDYRTKDTFPSVGALALILFSYLYFCLKAGPAWMKDRKPFDLTRVIFYYNIFQIIISAYLFINVLVILPVYEFTCQPIDYADNAFNRQIHNLTWLYTNLKLVELLDTIFFVLRKKTRQISSLHLYHHFLMAISSFVGLKYFPNGHSVAIGLVNTFVHMIMYSYYLISGMGPQYEKYLWWKKNVTILQMAQFGLLFIHNVIPLFNGCTYPKWINLSLSISCLHFTVMFGNFYYANYIKTPAKTTNSFPQKLE